MVAGAAAAARTGAAGGGDGDGASARAASASASRSAGSEGWDTVSPAPAPLDDDSAGGGAAAPEAADNTLTQLGHGSEAAPGAPHAHPDFSAGATSPAPASAVARLMIVGAGARNGGDRNCDHGCGAGPCGERSHPTGPLRPNSGRPRSAALAFGEPDGFAVCLTKPSYGITPPPNRRRTSPMPIQFGRPVKSRSEVEAPERRATGRGGRLEPVHQGAVARRKT
jgi:hypothetical protein